ncbi:AraC family transcriptional regulator [Alcanivorax sp. 24]|uniref:helix-turn-helix transcriptional regulator n=1 Tax=Alcanivorax sp. 24 TaxID=2545266 RepID=UPI00141513EF|nr:AraC family transcriptional regulator [Alcanivorax sp. 24]
MTEKVPRTISQHDISCLSWPLCHSNRLKNSSHEQSHPKLLGRFHVIPLRKGLVLHTVDIEELFRNVTESVVYPGIKLAVAIEGAPDIQFDQQRLPIGEQADNRNQASLVALTTAARFLKRSSPRRREKAVSLTFTPEWLYYNLDNPDRAWPAVHRFISTHLATKLWTPSPHALTVARQIIDGVPPQTPLERLYLENRCITLIMEGLNSLIEDPVTLPSASNMDISEREFERLERIRNYLDTHYPEDLTIADIAKQFGMSVSTLQRNFHRAFGTNVGGYIRDARLSRAVLAIQRDGVSISQAATIAGYSNTANFSSAIKRKYGVTPRQLRISAG